MIVWTFRDIIIAIIGACLILSVIIATLYYVVKSLIHKLFYKPCRKCKYCKLIDVASCGDGERWACTLHGMQKSLTDCMITRNTEIWKKCKNFEQ